MGGVRKQPHDLTQLPDYIGNMIEFSDIILFSTTYSLTAFVQSIENVLFDKY